MKSKTGQDKKQNGIKMRMIWKLHWNGMVGQVDQERTRLKYKTNAAVMFHKQDA